jgi:hypothetical protein
MQVPLKRLTNEQTLWPIVIVQIRPDQKIGNYHPAKKNARSKGRK